jgi:hypothetical protein
MACKKCQSRPPLPPLTILSEVIYAKSNLGGRPTLRRDTPSLRRKKARRHNDPERFQPYGTKDQEHKHQAYDLSFRAQGKDYTCRTDPGKSMNATDFVIGTDMKYKINGNKAEIKTPQDKKVKCKIVRVEAIP